MFEEPAELPPETERPIGEILEDITKILGPLPKSDRDKNVTRTDVMHETAALRSEAEDVLDTLRSGVNDPHLLGRANEIRRALLEAQADEIQTRRSDYPSGNQGHSV